MPVFCSADMRCLESVVLAPRRARQEEDSKFEASLDYIGKHCQRKKKRKKKGREGRREGRKKSKEGGIDGERERGELRREKRKSEGEVR